MNVPYRSIVLVVATLFLSVALLWSSISMESKKHIAPTVETEEVTAPAETPAPAEAVNE
jgi:cell division protein FtsN